MDNNLAVVVVADFKYLRKYLKKFLFDLREVGEYNGTLIILTSIFTPTFIFFLNKNKDNVIVKRFKKIKFHKNIEKLLNSLNTNGQPNRNKAKKFQWHKIHLFDEYFKKWNYVFFLDINMKIHYPINPILKNTPSGQLFARSDSYPDFKNKLSSQFDNESKFFLELDKKFDLNTTNYFQTGILFFDTNIIDLHTKKDLVDLTIRYPASITNEQGIFNIYFIFIKNCYKELPLIIDDFTTYFYWIVENKKVIITKQNRVKYK